MRAGPASEFHLAYCTNVHPGEDWAQTFAELQRYLPPLKAALGPDRAFGVGLRLSDLATRDLLQSDRLERFAAWLEQRGLYVFTLNGFPYGPFHQTVVKASVYAPDWTRPERLAYTQRLARVLARLLPEGVEGGISTVPVSYKGWHGTRAATEAALEAGAAQVLEAARGLARLEAETGRVIHLDLEPEPDCLLEDAAELAAFFERLLRRAGAGEAGLVRRHVRVCWDACHAAIEYEPTVGALAQFGAVGLQVGKLQVSSALKATLGNVQAREGLAAKLRPFAESTYLHQVVERRQGGVLRRHSDLGAALAHIGDPGALEWRVHFHVPVFAADLGGLDTTQGELIETLDVLRQRAFCEHVEIETYTWDVLPPAMRLDLPGSLRREYEWVLDRLGSPGLAAEPSRDVRRGRSQEAAPCAA